jgi:hypothetical protein
MTKSTRTMLIAFLCSAPITYGSDYATLHTDLSAYANPEGYESFYHNRVFNVYHGAKITPESLPHLMPKPDTETKIAVEYYFQTNKQLLKDMGDAPIAEPDTYRINFDKSIVDRVSAAGLMKSSKYNHNYIVELEVNGTKKKFVIKQAGPDNRHENLNVLLRELNNQTAEQRPYGTSVTQEEYSMLKRLGLDGTKQGMTRGGNHLLHKQFEEQHPKSVVKVPKTYLIHIPDQPLDVQDGNYAIVEEFAEGKYENANAHTARTFLQNLHDIANAMRHSGQWNMDHAGQFIITPEDTIVPVDLETANNVSPARFFNEWPEKYKSDTVGGIHQLQIRVPSLKTLLESADRDNNNH